MAGSWQCDDCLTFNDDPESPCVACGGRRRRVDPPPVRRPGAVVEPAGSAATPPPVTDDATGRGWTRSFPLPEPVDAGRRDTTVRPHGFYVPAKPPPSRGLRRNLTVVVAIVGVVIAVALFQANQSRGSQNTANTGSVQGGSGQQPPAQGATGTSGTALAQAQHVDALLTDSTAGRSHLLTTIDRASACDKAGAVAEIYVAANARQAVLSQARDADLSALPDGGALKTALVTLLTDSYDADEAYLSWVQSTQGSCLSTSASSFAAVQSANDQATRDKAAFLVVWNPVAEQFGLPARDAASI